ncbi:MAG: SDR family NAD(P)-dependent oxidoreductase [Actinomycetota bacterium]
MRALVTGAARGLGEAVARRLVADGASVALVDRSEAVRSTADRLVAGAAGTVVAAVGSVADDAWVAAEVPRLVAALGGLDLLVNNAGIGGPSTEVADTDPAAFREVLDVNLVGTFLVARACIPALRAAGGGAIVNLGSMFGQAGVAGGAPYSSSKGGVALLTHSLALELGPHGIRVNTIAPGNMLTEMHLDDLRTRAATDGVGLEEEVERVRRSVPLGRHGTGDDIAGAVAWLASPDAAYVTGQTIAVNGGVLLS